MASKLPICWSHLPSSSRRRTKLSMLWNLGSRKPTQSRPLRKLQHNVVGVRYAVLGPHPVDVPPRGTNEATEVPETPARQADMSGVCFGAAENIWGRTSPPRGRVLRQAGIA